MLNDPQPLNGTTAAALARIDERTRATNEAIERIERRLNKDFVTKDEFNPVRNVVYGLVGFILLSVAAAGVALVLIVP